MASTRRLPMKRMAANPARKTASLLTTPKIGMTRAHVATLQVSATNAFTTAEMNIRPAQTKPTTTATSGMTAFAMSGR